jgi:hypothetical protein
MPAYEAPDSRTCHQPPNSSMPCDALWPSTKGPTQQLTETDRALEAELKWADLQGVMGAPDSPRRPSVIAAWPR